QGRAQDPVAAPRRSAGVETGPPAEHRRQDNRGNRKANQTEKDFGDLLHVGEDSTRGVPEPRNPGSPTAQDAVLSVQEPTLPVALWTTTIERLVRPAAMLLRLSNCPIVIYFPRANPASQERPQICHFGSWLRFANSSNRPSLRHFGSWLRFARFASS